MINHEEAQKVDAELASGEPLTLSHVGRVFGNDFWELQVYALLDAQDAARAIQGAISRLAGGKEDATE